MAGFRSLWGTLPSSGDTGRVWMQLSSNTRIASTCPDGSAPLALPQNRKMCPTTHNQTGCVVWSFGSNQDFTFEEAVLERDARCIIHIFDPTIAGVHAKKKRSSSLRAAMTVHSTGLAHFDGLGDVPHPRSKPTKLFAMQTLPTLMAKLGHRHIHMLKIDTSGELEVLHALNASGASLRVFDQVLVEIHLYHPTPHGERQRCCYGMEDVARVFRIMETHGFAVMSLQPSSGHRFQQASCCAEVAWVKMPRQEGSIRRSGSRSAGSSWGSDRSRSWRSYGLKLFS